MVPHERVEAAYAHNRDPAERTPFPRAGDRVLFRADMWQREPPVPAVVLLVETWDDPQPVARWDGISDGTECMWRVVKDLAGRPVVDVERGAERIRRVRVEDPWPFVRLRLDSGALRDTREARLRGSPGWLPLDYLSRPVRLPSEIVVRPYPNPNW
jgi:hypothetical protein